MSVPFLRLSDLVNCILESMGPKFVLSDVVDIYIYIYYHITSKTIHTPS